MLYKQFKHIYSTILLQFELFYFFAINRNVVYLPKGQWLNFKFKPSNLYVYRLFEQSFCYRFFFFFCHICKNKKRCGSGCALTSPLVTCNLSPLLNFFVNFSLNIVKQCPTMAADFIARSIENSHLAEFNL